MNYLCEYYDVSNFILIKILSPHPLSLSLSIYYLTIYELCYINYYLSVFLVMVFI